jgi:hypothetical protein
MRLDAGAPLGRVRLIRGDPKVRQHKPEGH